MTLGAVPHVCECGHGPDDHWMSCGMCAECLCNHYELDTDR